MRKFQNFCLLNINNLTVTFNYQKVWDQFYSNITFCKIIFATHLEVEQVIY